MFIVFVCSVLFEDEARSRRYGVSAGTELEAEARIKGEFGHVEVSEVREATPSERASLRLNAGMIKLLA